MYASKIRVPGGWIVNQFHDVANGVRKIEYQATATFVPDEDGVWNHTSEKYKFADIPTDN